MSTADSASDIGPGLLKAKPPFQPILKQDRKRLSLCSEMAMGQFSLEVEMAELLFHEMLVSPAEDHAQHLKDLYNINVKNASERTLLHQAVMLGKPDWVREILEAGADPLIEDRHGCSALQIAEDMVSEHPGDKEREEIHRLVQSRLKNSQPSIYKYNEPKFTDIAASESSRETKILESDLTIVKQSFAEVKKELAEVKKELSNTVSKVDTLRLLKEIVAKLENSKYIGLSIPNPNPDKPLYKPNREACVEAIMRKTELFPSNEEYISKMKRWYEIMYDEDRITSCILEFLRLQSSVKVLVDFVTDGIRRMKPKFRDHDGIERNANGYYSFADFEERKAYVSGNWSDERNAIAQLAGTLSQLSVYLGFNNRGLPYSGEGDGEQRFKRILEEAENNQRDRWILDNSITWALGKANQQGKEIYLTSAVPLMIAQHGSLEGRSLLGAQLPSLLEYYDQLVVATLSKETKEIFESARE